MVSRFPVRFLLMRRCRRPSKPNRVSASQSLPLFRLRPRMSRPPSSHVPKTAGLTTPSGGGPSAAGTGSAAPSAGLHGLHQQHLLEGDGIVSNLFYFIYRFKQQALVGGAPAATSTVTSGGGCQPGAGASPTASAVDTSNISHQSAAARGSNPSAPPRQAAPSADICVPSTVIFEHNFPKAWYYPGASGDIERKLGRDVDGPSIVRDFASVATSSSDGAPGGKPGDVVGTYYSVVTDSNGDPATRVEFLDYDGLTDLVMRRTRRPDGFLQRWVSSPGKRNTVVQAIWSQHMCIVTKRQSRLALRDTRHSLFERCVTFEGSAHQAEEVFVAPHVKWQVRLICQQLVAYLHQCHRVAVKRMIAHFKVDCNSVTWFLYCSSLRISSDHTILNLAPLYVRHAFNEVAEEQADADRLKRMLRNDAYEVRSPERHRPPSATSTQRGRQEVNSPTSPEGKGVSRRKPAWGGKQATTSDLLIEALLASVPRPPSMGPLGDDISRTSPKRTTPTRAGSGAPLRSDASLHESSSQKDARDSPSTSASAARLRRLRAYNAVVKVQPPSSAAATALSSAIRKPSALQGPQTLLAAAPPSGGRIEESSRESAFRRQMRPRIARGRWQLVRVAFECGLIVRYSAPRCERVKEWCRLLLYTAYSHHLACASLSEGPSAALPSQAASGSASCDKSSAEHPPPPSLRISVPVYVMDLLGSPLDWMDALGLDVELSHDVGPSQDGMRVLVGPTMGRPVLLLQTGLDAMLQRRVCQPAAAAKWRYCAFRVILSRRLLLQQRRLLAATPTSCGPPV